MHQIAYSHVIDDAPGTARERERRAFDRSIELLEAAEAAGAKSREMVDALFFTRRLWSILLEDLASEDNALTDELRASLISIGIWVLRECEQVRLEKSDSVDGILGIMRTVRGGLQ